MSVGKKPKAAKMAVTLPDATFRRLERTRRRLKRSRSALVAEAIDAWLRAQEAGETDRQYIEAYLHKPESDGWGQTGAAIAAESWEPWK